MTTCRLLVIKHWIEASSNTGATLLKYKLTPLEWPLIGLINMANDFGLVLTFKHKNRSRTCLLAVCYILFDNSIEIIF